MAALGTRMVVGLCQRRVPEGHDAVADEFVQRAAMRHDDLAASSRMMLISRVSACGFADIDSDSVVKPRTSMNITEISVVTPPSSGAVPLRSMVRTICGDRYWPKALRAAPRHLVGNAARGQAGKPGDQNHAGSEHGGRQIHLADEQPVAARGHAGQGDGRRADADCDRRVGRQQADHDGKKRRGQEFAEFIELRGAERDAAEDLVKRAKMNHRAGYGRLEIGRVGILQPGRGAADDDEGAGKPLQPDFVQHIGCGHGDEPVDGAVIERQPSLAVECHRHLAGAKAVDAGTGIDGLFQNMAAGALRDAQHLCRKRRKKLAVEAGHHGNAAHGGVPFKGEADKTGARRLRNLFDRREKSAPLHQRQAAFTDHRDRRRKIGRVRAVAGNQRHGLHRLRVGQHLAKKRVAVRKPVAKRAGREVAKRLDGRGVEAIRFRHQDIDTDDQGSANPIFCSSTAMYWRGQGHCPTSQGWPRRCRRRPCVRQARVALKRAELGVAVEADIARAAVDAAEIGQRREQHHRRQQDRKKFRASRRRNRLAIRPII